MEAGTFLEPAIIAWWTHRTGKVATPTPLTILRNSDMPWWHASPDALIGDDEGFDAKNANHYRADEFKDGALPLGCQIQAQHYMAGTGRRRWHFGSLVGGNRLEPATVERDEAFIDRLMATERQWWETYVVGKVPPEPDGSDATRRAIHRLFPRELAGEARALDASFLDLRDMLDAAREHRRQADDEIADIEAKIKAAIGDAMYGVLPDGSRWQWKVEPRKEHVVKASEPRVLRFQAAKGVRS